jgi:hypothetical protein
MGTERYDGSRCECRPCVNFEVCGAWAVADEEDAQCCRCIVLYGFTPLRVVTTAGEDCPICLSASPRFVLYPSRCGHSICLGCFQHMWDPPAPPWPHPATFGFTGSYNPLRCRDVDCTCSNDIQQWAQARPDEFAGYVAACEAVTAAYYDRADPTRCPLCRAAVSYDHLPAQLRPGGSALHRE